MRPRWSGWLAALTIGCSLVGCQHGRDRKLRHTFVEEYHVPPADDKKFSEPPTYTEQKRQLVTPKGPAMPNMPSMRGSAGGGGPSAGPGLP